MPVKDDIEPEFIASPLEFKSKELKTFDYMDEDDLYDLQEYATKLNSLLLIVGSGDITYEEVVEIYQHLDKLGAILATYSEVFVIAKALKTLSEDMEENIDEFIKNSINLGVMCKAFSNDISTWIQMSFHTGAPNISFMNDTIAVNCETIASMLKVDNTDSIDRSENLDDIFDF